MKSSTTKNTKNTKESNIFSLGVLGVLRGEAFKGLSPAFIGVVVLALALGPLAAPARAQHVICCNLLVDVKGNWFGAMRQCRQMMEKASTDQRQLVCQQVKGNLCEDVAPYCQACTGGEAKKRSPGGGTLGPGDPIYDGLVDGARAAGISGFGPEYIGVQDRRGEGALVFFQIRIDAAGCPLANGDCIRDAVEGGRLPKGKQEGAKEMLVGSIFFAGSVLRVNGRYVNVETGVIRDAAQSETVTGSGREAIAQAMADMLRKLGLRCKQARGLIY